MVNIPGFLSRNLAVVGCLVIQRDNLKRCFVGLSQRNEKKLIGWNNEKEFEQNINY